MEDLGCLDTAGRDLLVSRHDIGDDQPATERAGLGIRDSFAERDGGRRSRGCELDDAEIVAVDDIIIDSKPELCVKRFLAIHV